MDDSARNYSEITVTIGYKKTEQQLIDIVHATNVSALHDLLTEAAQAGKTELVVQLSAFEGQSYQVQQTVDWAAKRDATLLIHGRHDPCIAVRAVPCVEAAAAVTVLDMVLGK